MVDQVWISEVMSNGDLGNKLGIREKWFGEPWEAPYVNHVVRLQRNSPKRGTYGGFGRKDLLQLAHRDSLAESGFGEQRPG